MGRTHTHHPAEATTPTAPVGRIQELAGVVLLVLLLDFTVLRGIGHGGLAVLFAVAPCLQLFVRPRWRRLRYGGVPLLMLWAVAVREAWCGSPLAAATGGVLFVAAAMALEGRVPYVSDLIVYIVQAPAAGLQAILGLEKRIDRRPDRKRRFRASPMLVPATVLLATAALLVFAMPGLRSALINMWTPARDGIVAWTWGHSPTTAIGSLAAGWLLLGLLHPLPPTSNTNWIDDVLERATEPVRRVISEQDFGVLLYTLVAATVMISGGIVYELQSLGREASVLGGTASSDARAGLYVLLGVLVIATLLLSGVFRGPVLDNPRVGVLRRWGLAWQALNIAMALVVGLRLMRAINVNGLSARKLMGLMVIAGVIGSHLWILRKIWGRHSFLWLLRRQLWTAAVVAWLAAVLPLESWAARSNAARILRGETSPAAQFSLRRLQADGLQWLPPLLEFETEAVHRGAAALLADYQQRRLTTAAEAGALTWTAWQLAEVRLDKQLEPLQHRLAPFADAAVRDAARLSFSQYAAAGAD